MMPRQVNSVHYFFKPSHFTGQWGGLPGVDLIKLFGANLLALF
jgi:hypothetical protein